MAEKNFASRSNFGTSNVLSRRLQSRRSLRIAIRSGLAVALVAAAFAAQELLSRWTPINSTFLLLYPAVFAAASLGGLWPGITATTVAAFAGWYFVLPVNHSLTIPLPGEIAELAIFYVMGLGFSVASFRRQRTRRAMGIAQAATANAEARLRVLVRSAPIGLWAVNAQGQLVVKETDGLPEELDLGAASIGMNLFDDSSVNSSFISPIRRALDGESFSVESQIGDRWYATHYAPTPDTARKVTSVLAVATDITARKKLEISQQAMIDTLHRERDLRKFFVSALTHDLRTPLQAARMGAELLILKAKDPVRAVTLAGGIIDHLDRISQMAQGILEAHKLEAGEPLPLDLQPCDLQALVRNVLGELNAVHGDRYRLIAKGTTNGYWDAEVLRRILENLASNAVKYGADGTPITVSVDDLGDSVCLSIHNHGQPIPLEEQARLFERFNRGSSASTQNKPGWGIGLSFVRSATEAHGGEVSVQTESTHGTTFKVTLPKISGQWCHQNPQPKPDFQVKL